MFCGGSKVVSFLISILKVFFLLSLALFLPRLFVFYSGKKTNSCSQVHEGVFKLGLEQISRPILNDLFQNDLFNTIGLITNETGIDQKGTANFNVLQEKELPIKAIFVPNLYDLVAYKRQVKTDLPILEWPAQARKKKRKKIEKIDLFVFDIQDLGMGSLYVETLIDVLKTIHQYNKPLVILDRPNFFGSSIEGFLGPLSFSVNGSFTIPIRHGMTVGELAQYCNNELFDDQLIIKVVPMACYHRGLCDSDILLAPIASADYTCLRFLKEVRPLDVRINLTKNTQTVALPDRKAPSKQCWYELRSLLKKYGVESTFCHYIHTENKETYSGLRLFVKNTDQISSFSILITILDFFVQSGVSLTFSDYFDRAIGTHKVREYMQGQVRWKELEQEINNEIKKFYKKAYSSFLYKPLPKVVML